MTKTQKIALNSKLVEVKDYISKITNNINKKDLKNFDAITDMEIETDLEWDAEFWEDFNDFLYNHPLHLEFEVERREVMDRQYLVRNFNSAPTKDFTTFVYYYGELRSFYNDYDDNGLEW